MTQNEYERLIQEFFAEAGCIYTKQMAEQMWRRLNGSLTEEQCFDIIVAWNRHRTNGG